MRISARPRVGTATAALCCALVTVAGCSLSPTDLPSFRGGVGSGYDINLPFASVLNLPAGADIMMDGLRVGEVRDLTVAGQTVIVTAHIRSDTHIPEDSRAVIRQNTLLGDTYIALDRNPAGAGPADYLPPGATLPAGQTTSPPPLEDTMSVLAYFIDGGSIQRIEDAIGRVNAVMPAATDVRALAATVAVDMRDLGQHTGELDRTIAALDQAGVQIGRRTAAIATMTTPTGMQYWKLVNSDELFYLGSELPAIGSIFQGGVWMVPMLDSLANSGGDIQATWADGTADTQKLANFLRVSLVPFLRNPSVNVVSVDSGRGDTLIGDVENVLRMLGAVQ
jgi:virulence factor Mce-like protein